MNRLLTAALLLCTLPACLDAAPGGGTSTALEPVSTPGARDFADGTSPAPGTDRDAAVGHDEGPPPDASPPGPDASQPPPDGPTCLDDAAVCWWSSECCSGFCTSDGAAYVQGVCAPPQPLGSPCVTDAACAEGACVDGLCRDDAGCKGAACPPACLQTAETCWGHYECCSGFCTYSGLDYTPGTCQPRQPLGGYCTDDAWCQSTNCVENACALQGCSLADAPCEYGQQCCSGLCAVTGLAGAPGHCVDPQAPGAPCESEAWCRSGICQDSKCQAPPDKPGFAFVYKQVLQTRGCTTGFCHGSPDAGLPMPSAAAAFDNLVEAASDQDWCLPTRVVPGDPATSLLWERVRPYDDTDPGPWCGPRMPLGSQGLSQPDVDLIKKWITSGAAP
ncbi:MAG: hypothetical protein H6744_17690 [Deltaproteobacteria bacterium]|nr:hypothetical protein [Deltaproteobacteria bacterium]